MPTIEVTVSPRGATTVTTSGYSGAACEDATRALEAALGCVQSNTRTAEFYATTVTATPLSTATNSPSPPCPEPA